MATPVVIAHNPIADGDDPSTRDVLDQVALVASALDELGYSYEVGPVTRVEAVEQWRGRLVFNLFEAPPGDFRSPLVFTQRLERHNIPFTGSPSKVLALTTNKLAARKKLERAGILVAPGGAFPEAAASVPSPWVLKPAWEDASLGLEGNPVCFTREELASRAAHLNWRFPGQQLVVEHFLPGREFNVSFLAHRGQLQDLPVAEIQFVDFPPDLAPVVSYEAKWNQDSFAYTHTPRVFPPADDPLVASVRELARHAATVCEVRGYARVDLRCDEAGAPRVLEVNANPCLAPDAGFLAAAAQAGLTPAEVIRRILADTGVA